MNRVKYWLLPAIVAGLSALGGAGCADDYLSLKVLHNQAPDDMCVIEPNVEDPYIPHGFMVAGSNGYFMNPLLQSNLVNRTGEVNGDIISLETASVELRAVDSDASRSVIEGLGALTGRTRYISGSVSPGGLTTTGFEAVDSDQARALAGLITMGQSVEILAYITVYGDLDGGEVASPTFIYPITVTNNGASGNFQNLGPCANLTPGFMGIVADCFGNGQDNGFIQCCTAADGSNVCPAFGG